MDKKDPKYLYFHVMGEPLLHPNLTDCLNIIRNIFPKTRITLVTNGINLIKMSNTFYKVCKCNDIEIYVTDYGLMDLNNILHQIKSKGVKIDIYQTCRDWYFQNIRLTEEINDCFNQCYHRKMCINYKEEKMYEPLRGSLTFLREENKTFDEISSKFVTNTECHSAQLLIIKNK